MNPHWQPSYRRFNSQTTASSIRSRPENAVPRGTVASRVHILQKLARTLPPESTTAQQRRSSASYYDSSVMASYIQPPIPNMQYVDRNHSFLGLTLGRSNHDGPHAMTGPRSDRNITPGPRQVGSVDRTGDDAASPWGLTLWPEQDGATDDSRSRYSDATGMGTIRKRNRYTLDIIKETSPSQDKTRVILSTTIDADSRSSSARLAEQEKASLPRSPSMSSATRRKTVKELFDAYGIETPHGIASDADSHVSPTTRAQSIERHETHCHLCFHINIDRVTKCSQCAHRLCSLCEAVSRTPQPVARDNSSHAHPSPSPRQQTPKQQTPKPHDPLREDSPRERAAKVKNSKSKLAHGSIPSPDYPWLQEQSKPHSPSPRLEVEEAEPRENSHSTIVWLEKQARQKERLAGLEKPRAIGSQLPNPKIPFPAKSKGKGVFTGVGNSPFVVADRGISQRPRPTSNYFARRPKSLSQAPLSTPRQQDCSVSTAPNEQKCEDPNCRAAHRWHTPYRHSAFCEITKVRTQEETDRGYVADRSHFDEDDLHHHHSYCHTRPECFPYDRPLSVAYVPPSMSEYVECYGYPRAHSRSASNMSSHHGTDDCQCKACQNTDHHNRCCNHDDHFSFLHHHYQPSAQTMYGLKSKPSAPSPPHRKLPLGSDGSPDTSHTVRPSQRPGLAIIQPTGEAKPSPDVRGVSRTLSAYPPKASPPPREIRTRRSSLLRKAYNSSGTLQGQRPDVQSPEQQTSVRQPSRQPSIRPPKSNQPKIQRPTDQAENNQPPKNPARPTTHRSLTQQSWANQPQPVDKPRTPRPLPNVVGGARPKIHHPVSASYSLARPKSPETVANVREFGRGTSFSEKPREKTTDPVQNGQVPGVEGLNDIRKKIIAARRQKEEARKETRKRSSLQQEKPSKKPSLPLYEDDQSPKTVRPQRKYPLPKQKNEEPRPASPRFEADTHDQRIAPLRIPRTKSKAPAPQLEQKPKQLDPETEIEDGHDCIWKSKYLYERFLRTKESKKETSEVTQSSSKAMGIKGVTVVLKFNGREDLVLGGAVE